MKTKSTSRSEFVNSRVLLVVARCTVGQIVSLAGLSKSGTETHATTGRTHTPGTGTATGSVNTERLVGRETLLDEGQGSGAGETDGWGRGTTGRE